MACFVHIADSVMLIEYKLNGHVCDPIVYGHFLGNPRDDVKLAFCCWTFQRSRPKTQEGIIRLAYFTSHLVPSGPSCIAGPLWSTEAVGAGVDSSTES